MRLVRPRSASGRAGERIGGSIRARLGRARRGRYGHTFLALVVDVSVLETDLSGMMVRVVSFVRDEVAGAQVSERARATGLEEVQTFWVGCECGTVSRMD